MKVLLCLLLVLAVTAQKSGKGGLICDKNQYHYPAYIEGCYLYTPDNLCGTCEYNYKLSNGICLYSPKSSQDCCLTFSNSSRCLKCANGLTLNSQTGLCEDIKITGCLKRGAKGCQICASNYDIVSGICVLSIKGCTLYNSNLVCTACQDSYTLLAGACIPNINTPNIPNCKIVNQYGCGQCNEGFRPDGKGGCQTGLVGCILYANDGCCVECQSPFFQLVNNNCKPVGCTQLSSDNSCSACNSANGFTLVNAHCQIANCIYFSNDGCLLCAPGLVPGPLGCNKPAPPVCLLCKSNQYRGIDNKCHPRDVHCINYKNGVCTSCCEAFFLDSSYTCQPVVPGCVYSKGVCASCSSPFTFTGTTCTIPGCLQYCKQGCLSCDSRLTLQGGVCGLPNCQIVTNYVCQQCLSGYSLNSEGKCIPIDPNCEVRNSINICLKCKDGYQLGNNGKCSSLKLGCNYVDGRCTSCRAPFVYNATLESCSIDGCLNYFIGGCENCATGYTLLYNSCKLPNCLVSKQGKCLECDPDFVFRSDGTCVSKDEFCDKMDANGTCIKCMSSYYYSQKLLKCVKKAPGCQYDSQDNCIACDKPFTLQAGRCTIKGCLRFDEQGCYQCEYPYVLDKKTKTCTIAHCLSFSNDGRCSSCSEGYALSANFLCQTQDQYCQKYDDSRINCLTCIKGYFVDCNGRCQYGDQHCSSFDNNGICVNCDRLYFLNSLGKCQLRDPQCLTYINGYCSTCLPYYFPKNGICMANLIGCKQQLSYQHCKICDEGYNLKAGTCIQSITRLNWNSIDMDFGDCGDSASNAIANSVFTVSATSTLNLVPAFQTAIGSLFFSSSAINGASVLLSASGSSGWSPSGQSPSGQFVGFNSSKLQTFYACDVKQLTGSSLSSFTLEYSLDGTNYIKINDFSFTNSAVDTITTFYFKPVYAKLIRLVVQQGIPNIRIEFYYSSAEKIAEASASKPYNNTFITNTVVSTIEGAETGGSTLCGKDSLCWAGVQSCQPRQILGFSLIYNTDSTDRVSAVKIQYSTDGLNFVCWNNCVEEKLSNNSYTFSSPLLAQKMHIHFTTYTGHPKFGIKFSYA